MNGRDGGVVVWDDLLPRVLTGTGPRGLHDTSAARSNDRAMIFRRKQAVSLLRQKVILHGSIGWLLVGLKIQFGVESWSSVARFLVCRSSETRRTLGLQ